MRSTASLFFSLGAVAKLATAQAKFTDMNWAAGFMQGARYNISWTSSGYDPVSANLWSGNYSQPIFANDVASSPFLWTVPQIMPGTYSIQLLDNGVQSDVSPNFQISAPAYQPVLPNPDNASALPTTKMQPAPPAGTGTGIPSTVTLYWDEECGCHKSALVPAPAATTVTAPCSSGNNYTASPPLTTPVISAYTSGMPNAAGRTGSAVSGLFAVAILALANFS